MRKRILLPAAIVLLLGLVAFIIPGAEYSEDSPELKVVTERNTPSGDLKETYPPIVVLELFTSQGCSSCPPADALLEKVKEEHPQQVFALSYHVDYWNYIGWKDPFSKKEYTARQSFYNRQLGYLGNYTPEIVVNGQAHFVGSKAREMASHIEHFANMEAKVKIELDAISREANRVLFEYVLYGNLEEMALRAVLVLNERITEVTRGENRNRTLKNSNIVIGETYLNVSDTSGKGSIEIPSWVGKSEALTLMLISENDHMALLGRLKQLCPSSVYIN